MSGQWTVVQRLYVQYGWSRWLLKEFHVHVDLSSIVLGLVLTHPGEGSSNDHLSFASGKLSTIEKNYTTMEREGIVMVYVLQKFRHYLLGGHFNTYTNHYALKYLVNKPVLGDNIFQQLLLFQEFNFEIIVKLGGLNLGLDHLSIIESGEDPTSLEDNLPDMQVFFIAM